MKIEIEKSELELKTNRDEYNIYYKWHIVWNIPYDIYTDELYEERKKAFMVWLQFNQEEIKKLNERIRFLEQCLDNKEKVNKSLREENKRLSDFLECEA